MNCASENAEFFAISVILAKIPVIGCHFCRNFHHFLIKGVWPGSQDSTFPEAWFYSGWNRFKNVEIKQCIKSDRVIYIQSRFYRRATHAMTGGLFKIVMSGSWLQCDGGSNKAGLQQPWSTGIAVGTTFEFYFLFFSGTVCKTVQLPTAIVSTTLLLSGKKQLIR